MTHEFKLQMLAVIGIALLAEALLRYAERRFGKWWEDRE